MTGLSVSSRRIAEVDTLRGFALFGILVTNVIFATTLWSFGAAGDDLRLRFDGPIDRVVESLVSALFEGRFYLLFAFLFGYSFTLQIAAAQRAGVSANARLLRRCLALLMIGVAHVFLLWIGDILTLYAFLCLILIPLKRLKPRTAAIGGAVLYVLWCAWGFLPGDHDLQALGDLFDMQRMHDGYNGTFADTFGNQVWLAPAFIALIWFTQGFTAFGMFLIGMAAGKRELFTDRETLRHWAPRVLTGGLAVGLPVSAVTFGDSMGWITEPGFWPGVQELVNPLMTFAYIAGIVWLAQIPRTAQIVGVLAPAGRMAATNYIGQSIVLMVIYTGYGFALVDKIPPAGVIAIALLTYAAQLRFSQWWLRNHRYGPVEWALRAATYLSLPEWKRTEQVSLDSTGRQ
ncbi:uncharacterized protein DFR70_101246 [Nocardia tenerifensis]|uniref:DUF418 domain-containing protein n=1 Tax=Nocardia tenerifensis TaxID=228006 RepID=A0A318KD65_9NOCA|nr:DUF418 domain-containing protein [Nocardia tenerifensis]PXX70825.1 uncharacterized protein DFR70_101246 [Nocardia tenerifensis]